VDYMQTDNIGIIWITVVVINYEKSHLKNSSTNAEIWSRPIFILIKNVLIIVGILNCWC